MVGQAVTLLHALMDVLVGHITKGWSLPIGVRSAGASWKEIDKQLQKNKGKMYSHMGGGGSGKKNKSPEVKPPLTFRNEFCGRVPSLEVSPSKDT